MKKYINPNNNRRLGDYGIKNPLTLELATTPTRYLEKKKTEGANMASIKESAKAYVPKTTMNIADLNQVPCDLELEHKIGSTEDGKTFEYDFTVVDGNEYRVPQKVLSQLKAILEEMPDLEFFKVKKEGEGLKTTYTVIPVTTPKKPQKK